MLIDRHKISNLASKYAISIPKKKECQIGGHIKSLSEDANEIVTERPNFTPSNIKVGADKIMSHGRLKRYEGVDDIASELERLKCKMIDTLDSYKLRGEQLGDLIDKMKNSILSAEAKLRKYQQVS